MWPLKGIFLRTYLWIESRVGITPLLMYYIGKQYLILTMVICTETKIAHEYFHGLWFVRLHCSVTSCQIITFYSLLFPGSVSTLFTSCYVCPTYMKFPEGNHRNNSDVDTSKLDIPIIYIQDLTIISTQKFVIKYCN